MKPPTVLYVRRSEVHGNPPTDDSFRIVLAMDAEAYQGQLQARVRELERKLEISERDYEERYEQAADLAIRVRELEERIETLQTTDDHRTLYAEARVRELEAKLTDAEGLLLDRLARVRELEEQHKRAYDELAEAAAHIGRSRLALVPANEETAK